MPDKKSSEISEKYKSAYSQFGYSPKALGWDKGGQDIRFEVLTSFFDFHGKSVLDIGCGFGDINRILEQRYADSYIYTGVDLVGDLTAEGRRRYPGRNVSFLTGEFMDRIFREKSDIVLGSGIFNQKFADGENQLFNAKLLEKAWNICSEGMAFDFLSDKVDFTHDHTHHNSPEETLRFGYSLSRKVALRNDYMPFEFCLFMGKDDSFDQNSVFKTRV